MVMKNCGCRNVRGKREIKDNDKYITFEIWLKVGSLDKIIIASSEPKDTLGRSVKGLINSLGLKTNVRAKKYNKARYTMILMLVLRISFKGY